MNLPELYAQINDIKIDLLTFNNNYYMQQSYNLMFRNYILIIILFCFNFNVALKLAPFIIPYNTITSININILLITILGIYNLYFDYKLYSKYDKDYNKINEDIEELLKLIKSENQVSNWVKVEYRDFNLRMLAFKKKHL